MAVEALGDHYDALALLERCRDVGRNVAVRETVHGRPVRNLKALANPEVLDHFRALPELRR